MPLALAVLTNSNFLQGPRQSHVQGPRAAISKTSKTPNGSISYSRSTAGSPRLGGRHEFTSLGSCGGAPPDILRSPSDNEIAERFYARAGGGRRRRRKKRLDRGSHGHDQAVQAHNWFFFTAKMRTLPKQNSNCRDSNYFPGGSHSPSSGAGGDGSLYDSDSLRSRASCDSRIRISDLQFGMRRFMEDDPQGRYSYSVEIQDDHPKSLTFPF